MKKLLVFLLILFGYCNAYSQDSLHFTFPTNNAKLVAGSDTLITWDGIAERDSVRIEYSTDNGNTWFLLSTKAVGLNYNWMNLPKKVGNENLIRLIHIGERVNKLDAPYIEWEKTYGGSKDDNLYDIEELKDGGFIAIGRTESNDFDISLNKGGADIWLLKVDSNGKVIFSKTYGGSNWDVASFIRQTKDGAYILGGYTKSKDFDFKNKDLVSNHFLIKLDTNGYIEWENTYGNTTLNRGGFSDILETDDGGYILIGDSSYSHICGNPMSKDIGHIYILKVDNSGYYKWSKTYGGNSDDHAYSIVKTNDGGYILAGSTFSDCGNVKENKGGNDAWILKLDKNGYLQWQKTYGGSGDDDRAISIKEALNNEYIVLGFTNSNDGDINYNNGKRDIWIMRIDKTGKIIWSKTYGGTDTETSWYSKIQITTDNGYIFVGVTSSNDGDVTNFKDGYFDGWFIKLDDDGNIKYKRTFGGSGKDMLYATQQTSDLGYIICGQTYSSDGDIDKNKGGGDGWIIKLSTKYQPIDTLVVPFSIVAPVPASRDVDMGKVYLGEWRDSTVAYFVYNIGSYKFRVDSIYIRGADKTAFSLIGGFPKYNVEPDSGKSASFKFTPSRVGLHKAEIVIITQTETLIQNIIGEGLKKRALIAAELMPFSDLICGNSTISTLEIKSIGGDTLRIKELNLSGTDYQDFLINETLPINLAPDSTKTITIGFKTNVPGIKTAALEIKSNAEPDSVLSIPLTARKDSIALVPNPTLIDLGTLFPNQTKDTSLIISNLGTIKTDGKVTFTSNISCPNPAFSIDSGRFHPLAFTFTGMAGHGNINEKITVWDEVCKYSREVIITGKVVSPHFQGFTAVQCKSYSNDYKLTLNNGSSNRIQITSIIFEKNPQLFEIDPSLVFPIAIEPFSTNYGVKVTYKDDAAQKFTTAVNCYTNNEFIPILTDTIYAETVDYIRTTSGLINDTIRTASNPFAVSYDSESENGKNKFTYAIQVNEIANDMEYLTGVSDLEVIINYNTNVLGVDFDSQSKNVKVLLGDELQGNYSIKSIKEIKINQYNSQIIINLENFGKQIITKNAYKILEMDFSAYLSNYNLTDEQNSDKSRKAIISHTITTPDECIVYETSDNAYLDIEKLCVDEFRSIKIPNNPDERFYLSNVIPHPIGTEGASIEYGLGFECEVTITVYDISGAVVLTPINEIQKAGTHKLAISSKSLSAGAYFIEMKAGPFKETKRVIVE